MNRRELMLIVSIAAGLTTNATVGHIPALAKGNHEVSDSKQGGGNKQDSSKKGSESKGPQGKGPEGKGPEGKGPPDGNPRGYERSHNPKAAGGPENPGKGNPHDPY